MTPDRHDPARRSGTAGDGYRLLLFVAGDEPNSRLARKNASTLVNGMPGGGCKIETIDVLKNYEAALQYSVLVTPTLLLLGPTSPVRICGTLTDLEPVRGALAQLGEISHVEP